MHCQDFQTKAREYVWLRKLLLKSYQKNLANSLSFQGDKGKTSQTLRKLKTKGCHLQNLEEVLREEPNAKFYQNKDFNATWIL